MLKYNLKYIDRYRYNAVRASRLQVKYQKKMHNAINTMCSNRNINKLIKRTIKQKELAVAFCHNVQIPLTDTKNVLRSTLLNDNAPTNQYVKKGYDIDLETQQLQ